MNNKKITIIRLVIFYTLAILPLLIATPIFSNLLGEPMFTGDAAASQLTMTWGVLGMCCPALANVLTRIITREGMQDSYLKLDLKKGRGMFYLAAFLVPLLYMLAAAFIIYVVFCRDVDSIFTTEDVAVKIWTFIGQTGTTLLLFLPFFGEEFGWRAYMTPKLEQIMPMPAALIVGGILWGLWHAPLTVQGHNFGLEYNGYPYIGILLMCVMCTALGAFLTLLTKRTQSVIPAAIAHGINNNMGFGVILTLFGSEKLLERIEEINQIYAMELMLIPIIIIGAISFVILVKESKQEKQ